MTRRPAILLLALLALAPAAAGAQDDARQPDESLLAPSFQVGPLRMRPSLILREVGYDSNVLNVPRSGGADFTATFGGRVDTRLEGARVAVTSSSFTEYAYYEAHRTERGANGGTEGRVEFRVGRMRPHVSAGIFSSQERPTAEIDRRARRVQAMGDIGIAAPLATRTTVTAGYRRTSSGYAPEEQFRGVQLASALNGTSSAFSFGAALALTPLTTVAVGGERVEDRFEHSPGRDANLHRVAVSATFHPLALVSGRASVGLRTLRPVRGQLRPFTGLTASVAVAYLHGDASRIAVTLDRDLRYSYSAETPYYVATGTRASFTRRLLGRVDAQVLGGLERLAYKARPDLVRGPAGTDGVRTVGGGIGYRLTGGTRVGITVERASRASAVPDRTFSRTRVYTTLSYGY